MKSPAKLDLSFGNGLDPGLREIALSAISHVTNCISSLVLENFHNSIFYHTKICRGELRKLQFRDTFHMKMYT